MAKVAIVTSGHFCTSPRVWREADALSAAGFEIVVIGVAFDPAQAALDRQMLATRTWRHRVAEDLCGRGLRWQLRRVQARVARSALRFGLESPHALSYAAPSLLTAARAEAADLTILHLEPALWVGTRLLRDGVRVGVDIEDWHSENDAGAGWGDPAQRRFLARLEGTVLRGAAHASTTSHVLAEALASRFGCRVPVTIYNAITPPPLQPTPEGDALRLVWFSQTLGAGRGLEDLCAALPSVPGAWEVEIRARATDEARRWLYGLLPETLQARVHLVPLVSPDALSAAVGRHDVGLALERPQFPSRNLSITNKAFEYLQNGLPVAASDTAGQREVLGRVPGSGELYRSGDAAGLAALLGRMVARRDAIRADRARLHRDANAALAYPRQAATLVASVRAALG